MVEDLLDHHRRRRVRGADNAMAGHHRQFPDHPGAHSRVDANGLHVRRCLRAVPLADRKFPFRGSSERHVGRRDAGTVLDHPPARPHLGEGHAGQPEGAGHSSERTDCAQGRHSPRPPVRGPLRCIVRGLAQDPGRHFGPGPDPSRSFQYLSRRAGLDARQTKHRHRAWPAGRAALRCLRSARPSARAGSRMEPDDVRGQGAAAKRRRPRTRLHHRDRGRPCHARFQAPTGRGGLVARTLRTPPQGAHHHRRR